MDIWVLANAYVPIADDYVQPGQSRVLQRSHIKLPTGQKSVSSVRPEAMLDTFVMKVI